MGAVRAGQGSHGTANQSSALLIKNSLRFDGSSYLIWTPSSTGDSVRKWTISLWVKQNYATGSTAKYMLTAGPEGAGSPTSIYPYTYDVSGISGQYYFIQGDGTRYVRSVPKYRDESAWYHMVFQSDADNATTGDKLKIFVNGERITTDTPGPIPITQDTYWNSANPHKIARIGNTTNWTGYMAEFHSVDNQLVDPSYFGFTDPLTNTWRPKKYEGTYGTNGFYLDFSDFSDLGADRSGNGNNFTPTGFTADDVVPDSPSGVVFSSAPTSGITTNNSGPSNYCTLNPIDRGTLYTPTLSDGNLKSASPNNTQNPARGTIATTSGKWYFEGTCTARQYNPGIGVMSANASLGTGDDFRSLWGTQAAAWYSFTGGNNTIWSNGGYNSSYATAFATNDVLMIAYDVDAGKIWFGKNGTWNASGDPASGTNHAATFTHTDPIVPFIDGSYSSSPGDSWTLNFGQKDFSYTPPSGFLPLCTANLPRPTKAAVRPDKYFKTVLWTGDGNDNRSITGVGFQPSLTWIKTRSVDDNHSVHDEVRGANRQLFPNSNDVEFTSTTLLKSFDSDGFTLGTDSSVNGLNRTLVAWCWKAGGAAVSNTDGSITSQVSANQDAGFSIVSYTGTGSAATAGHGLGVAPSMVIIKRRNVADDWGVYHTSLGNTKYVYLNSTQAANTESTIWNNTSPTSSVFSIGTSAVVNANTGTYVAYCFAEVEGYSKFGSYTGNGNADGVFVHCGFKPAWIMWKETTVGESWFIHDTARTPYNVSTQMLRPNSNLAEATGDSVDILSNGFKFRSGGAGANYSGRIYIFAAFAETPINNLYGGQANAR